MNSTPSKLEPLSDWREEVRNLVSRYDNIYFYSTDPGATAVIEPIYQESQKVGKANTWFVEGWAAHAYLPKSQYISGNQEFFIANSSAQKQAVIMGQQVNFERAHSRLKHFKNSGVDTVFISDHWKNIAEIFAPPGTNEYILPNHLFVPDNIAYDLQINSLTKHGINKKDIENSLKIIPHIGVGRSVEQIHSFTNESLRHLKVKYSARGWIIVMMLDCIQGNEKKYLGFDWKSALDQAISHFRAQYKTATLLIKPHPRQNLDEVQQYLAHYHSDKLVRVVQEPKGEPLVAIADEIWGMTTILLIVALRVGKPIKVFMPDRTLAGANESNAHIEPYLVK